MHGYFQCGTHKNVFTTFTRNLDALMTVAGQDVNEWEVGGLSVLRETKRVGLRDTKKDLKEYVSLRQGCSSVVQHLPNMGQTIGRITHGPPEKECKFLQAESKKCAYHM
jgi:hypothetical protein